MDTPPSITTNDCSNNNINNNNEITPPTSPALTKSPLLTSSSTWKASTSLPTRKISGGDGERGGTISGTILSPNRKLFFVNNNSSGENNNNNRNNISSSPSSSSQSIDDNHVNNQQPNLSPQPLRKCNSNENVGEQNNNNNNNNNNTTGNNSNSNSNSSSPMSTPSSPSLRSSIDDLSPRLKRRSAPVSPKLMRMMAKDALIPISPPHSPPATDNGQRGATMGVHSSMMMMNNMNNNNPDGILVKVWVPMEYTGQLYRVRKFSSGKSTQEIVHILNSQLAPIYQSSKNKLFLNNADKPIPGDISLKNLHLAPTDILYLRREPEYELVAPGYPQKGSLVLDKDIKVGEVLQKIEQWLGPIEGVTDANPTTTNPLNRSKGEYFTTLDPGLMSGGANGGDVQDSPYKLLKKLFLPTHRPVGKNSRGYYLRLWDQKQFTNYGIKIKDTLIFKKKAVNRGLCVDDAHGGIEITVLYSPLSMLPLYPEVDPSDEGSASTKEKEKEKEREKELVKDLLIKVEKLPLNDPSMLHHGSKDDTSIQTGSSHPIIEGNGFKTERRKGKDRRTPSSVGLPYNLVHKTHVDFDFKWTGKNVEEAFEFKEKLGQGGYGAVFKVQHKESGIVLAVKVLSTNPTRIADIEKEIDLLKKCRCPNVLSYYGSVSKVAELWILMDYCAVGSIKDMMKTCCDTLDEDQISSVADGVLKGLAYLHSKGIVHLDVKAANVLLSESGQLKIADFGVSQQLQSSTGQSNVFIGSPLYMAPELILKEPFSNKADVWSLGITMIELAEGRAPNRGLKSMNQLTEIPNMPPPKLTNPKDWSPTFNDFIAKCLVKDPAQRPSVIELLSHPFVVGAKTTDSLSGMMKQCLQIRDHNKEQSEFSHYDK